MVWLLCGLLWVAQMSCGAKRSTKASVADVIKRSEVLAAELCACPDKKCAEGVKVKLKKLGSLDDFLRENYGFDPSRMTDKQKIRLAGTSERIGGCGEKLGIELPEMSRGRYMARFTAKMCRCRSAKCANLVALDRGSWLALHVTRRQRVGEVLQPVSRLAVEKMLRDKQTAKAIKSVDVEPRGNDDANAKYIISYRNGGDRKFFDANYPGKISKLLAAADVKVNVKPWLSTGLWLGRLAKTADWRAMQKKYMSCYQKLL